MSTVESIQRRHSVRTYTGEPLREEHLAQIKQFINQLKAPFGVKARIELIRTISNDKPIKLGTYGFIKGASEFLAMIYQEAPFAQTAAAYMFEQLILFCTSLGLGTCWLAGFNRNSFKKQIALQPNEKLRIVSPVGYAGETPSFMEKYIVRADKNHASRKPFETLFFEKDFQTPLPKTAAGAFLEPLEMVRLAPSASNKQEWRALRKDQTLHFYKKPYPMFDSIDMGIALCHFELTCKEIGIGGRFEVLGDAPEGDKLKYVVSWI